jgi:hypothetical protein
MKKLILLFNIVLACVSSFSQNNFQPATIVTINGQSITGQIDYKNWKQTPSTVSFRTDKTSAPTNYGIDDLTSFTVSGDLYKRAIVDISERREALSHLSLGDSMNTRKDTVFLLTIVSGPKSLHYYTDNVNHFYIETENGYEWLRYNRYKVKEEVLVASAGYAPTSEEYVRTNKEYLGQLREYLKDCSNLSGDVKYDIKSLRNTFISYYDCRGINPDYLQKPEGEKIEIGMIAGVCNTTFNVNTTKNDIIGRIGFSPSVDFAAGAFFDIVFPRQRGRISLNNEVLFSSYKTTGEYHYPTSPSISDDYTFQFAYSYLKLNNMLRYKFFTNSADIFINGGISNGYVVNETNKLTVVRSRTYSDEKTTTSSKGFSDTRKHELGFLLGGGVRKNRASFELRAEKGLGPFGSSGYGARVMRYFALLGYRFR